MTNEPFGRQPETVTIMIIGDYRDTPRWESEIARIVATTVDTSVRVPINRYVTMITIHPRAVND